MKTASSFRTAALSLALSATAVTMGALGTGTGFAQAPATQAGSVQGAINNPAGQPVKEGAVKFTTDRSTQDDKVRKYQYTFPVSADGTFKADGIAPGDYVLFYQVNDKTLDYVEHVVIKAGDNLTVNDDMSRQDYLSKMSPEQRKQVEEFKKKNAEVVNANKTVANLNTLLTKARDEQKAKNFDAAVADMQQATTQKPDEAVLWLELGNAQFGQAGAEKDATKKTQGLKDSAASYQKAVDTNTASKKPNPQFAGAAYNGIGQAQGKMNQVKEAGDAYDKAAAAEPAKAGMYYFNEAVTLNNAGNSEAAGVAADKAVAADPTKADAYYIKGQALVGKSTTDAKSGKIVPPPGCIEAYSKYLELAPNGQFAPAVKEVMAAFDEKVVSSYKASKKR